MPMTWAARRELASREHARESGKPLATRRSRSDGAGCIADPLQAAKYVYKSTFRTPNYYKPIKLIQSKRARMSSADSAEEKAPSLSITLENSSALRAFSAMTFSSMVPDAMSRYTMTFRV
jgi:hypothetical protein